MTVELRSDGAAGVPVLPDLKEPFRVELWLRLISNLCAKICHVTLPRPGRYKHKLATTDRTTPRRTSSLADVVHICQLMRH